MVGVLLGVWVNVGDGSDVNVEVGREVRVGEGVHVGAGVFVEVTVGVRLGVDVLVGVKVDVAEGRSVRVGEGVHVGRGVLVEVRVQTMGVRVKVGVADKAAMNNCMRAVLAAAVARKLKLAVGVDVTDGVDVGAVVFVTTGVCVGRTVNVAVAVTGCGDAVGSAGEVDVDDGATVNVSAGV
jgi:hypothetical protein